MRTQLPLLVLISGLVTACTSSTAVAALDGATADTTPGADAAVPTDDVVTSDAASSDVDDASASDSNEPPEEAFAALESTWCPAYADRFCAATAGCGCAEAPGYPTGDACVASFIAQCGALLGQYRSAVESGQALVDLDGVPVCLQRIDALARDCATLPGDTFFTDCPILVPVGAPPAPGEGQPCAEGGRCQGGLRCSSAGTCQVPGLEAAPCAGPTDCSPALRCTAGACAALDVSRAGDTCAPDSDCGALVCTASSHRRCVAIAPGDACQSDEDCRSEEFCQSDTCTVRPGLGESCGNGAACTDGLGCDETGHCATLPEAGAACALGVMGPLLCAPGSTCKDGLCGAIPAEGEPCAQGTPACGPGLGCAFGPTGSVCVVPGPAGTYCENDPTCATGLYCEYTENACRPWRERGARCSAGNECGPEGACLPDATFTFRCADVPKAGDACFLYDCAKELRCESPYAEGACVREFCTALKF